MSSTVIIAWGKGPGIAPAGVRRDTWLRFCEKHGLELCEGNGVYYAGTGQDRVEADRHGRYQVTFTVSGGGYREAARLALALWAAHGGSMTASFAIRRAMENLDTSRAWMHARPFGWPGGGA